MRFAEAWRRRGLWAAAATLVVPGVLVVTVATVLLGGGFRGLGAVAQVVTGPEVPAATVGAQRVAAETARPRVPTVPRVAVEEGLAGAPAAAAGTPGAGGPPAQPVATAPTPGGAAPAPGVAVAPAPAPATPPNAAPAPRNPLREAGESVAGAVGSLPPPAGPAGQDAVTTVLDIVVPPASRAALLPGS
jgi:hypothetical protein